MRTIKHPLPKNQYFNTEISKKQIYLHHTVSGNGAEGDLNWWRKTPDRIATCGVVERDGDWYECFDPKYWAYHLGINSHHINKYRNSKVPQPNQTLNKHSIGIEIDSWGGLVKDSKGNWCTARWSKTKKKFVANTKRVIPTENVTVYKDKYRGFYAFEKYTDKQLKTVKELCKMWNKEFGIDLTYHDDIWDVCPRAYAFESGIFSHTSVRKDKSDCHPQPELIETLKCLMITPGDPDWLGDEKAL